MRKLTNLILSVGIFSGCATLNEKEMHCYKYGDCTKTFPITPSVISLEYKAMEDGTDHNVYVHDEFNGAIYRIVRRNDGYDSLELEVNRMPLNSSDIERMRAIEIGR